MQFYKKVISITLFIFISYQLSAQLYIRSEFDRDNSQFNIELINKSQYVFYFMTEHIDAPPYISIESFDSEDNSIEWLRYPNIGHGGPFLFPNMYQFIIQNESYSLSFKINPDKKKRNLEYFVVTYYLPLMNLDVENIEMEKLIKERHKHIVSRERFQYKERFYFDKQLDK